MTHAYNASDTEYADYERTERHRKSAVTLPVRHIHDWRDALPGIVECNAGTRYGRLSDGSRCQLRVPRDERHYYDERDGWRLVLGGWAMVRE